MAITEVAGLSGNAEIQGAQKRFDWDGQQLSIYGVDYSDLLRILDGLASGAQWDVRPPTADAPRTTQQVPAVKYPEVEKPVHLLNPVTMTETITNGAKKDEPVVPSSRAGELPLGDQLPKNGATLDHALVTADSLVKVLTVLKAQGYGEWKSLLDACVKHKEDVPVLKKISGTDQDFKDRILRVAASKLQITVPDDA